MPINYYPRLKWDDDVVLINPKSSDKSTIIYNIGKFKYMKFRKIEGAEVEFVDSVMLSSEDVFYVELECDFRSAVVGAINRLVHNDVSGHEYFAMANEFTAVVSYMEY